MTKVHKAYAVFLVVAGVAALVSIFRSKASTDPEGGNFKVSTFTNRELRNGTVGTTDWLKIQSTDDREIILTRVELNKKRECTIGDVNGTVLHYGEVTLLMINPLLPGCKDALEVSVQSDKGISFYNFD